MARTAYSVRQDSRGLSIALPSEVAVSLGIVDMQGNLITPMVQFGFTPDKSSATISPFKL
ncbi:hypothetical protein [uncultured Methanolobus sp.]|uniref:hypothetical protein n=1 Tax=uncultured Methanolobus sp. TaxID=218300 RepID=UPI002AAA9D4E|nr:hypothetical protein [uncultured Methanolobus sp.]